MMIRTSKHKISDISNQAKLVLLDTLFLDYKVDLMTYIAYIIDGVLPLKVNLSSKLLPTETLKHSKYKREIYKQASQIIRSQLDRSNKRRYKKYKMVYTYFKKNGRQTAFVNTKFSDLSIKNIMQSKYFTVPKLNNLTITLTNEFFNIQSGSHFDSFINLKLPYFNDKGTRALQVNLPLKYHRHSNGLMNNGFKLRDVIQLKEVNGEYYVNLIWEKVIPVKVSGKSKGIDLGYNKLIATSDGEVIGTELKELYGKISRKKQGSKAFKRSLTERDNLINYYVNKIDLDGFNTIVIEDLCNVKYKSKLSRVVNNKLQRWSYKKTINKIERICELNGISVVKVSPAYTSQTCSKCGHTCKESRKMEEFDCISCGYKVDADLNASINIHNRGIYSSSNKKSVFL